MIRFPYEIHAERTQCLCRITTVQFSRALLHTRTVIVSHDVMALRTDSVLCVSPARRCALLRGRTRGRFKISLSLWLLLLLLSLLNVTSHASLYTGPIGSSVINRIGHHELSSVFLSSIILFHHLNRCIVLDLDETRSYESRCRRLSILRFWKFTDRIFKNTCNFMCDTINVTTAVLDTL